MPRALQLSDVKTELLFEMDLILGSGARQDVGTPPSGARIIVPVTGGTFAGPHLHRGVSSLEEAIGHCDAPMASRFWMCV
jgi:hypothetical protein